MVEIDRSREGVRDIHLIGTGDDEPRVQTEDTFHLHVVQQAHTAKGLLQFDIEKDFCGLWVDGDGVCTASYHPNRTFPLLKIWFSGIVGPVAVEVNVSVGSANGTIVEVQHIAVDTGIDAQVSVDGQDFAGVAFGAELISGCAGKGDVIAYCGVPRLEDAMVEGGRGGEDDVGVLVGDQKGAPVLAIEPIVVCGAGPGRGVGPWCNGEGTGGYRIGW